MKTARLVLALAAALALLLHPSPAAAQTDYPYYVVQEGDSLYWVAAYFHTSVNSLMELNPLADPNTLKPGNLLKVPGFDGITGQFTRAPLPAGESARTLSRATGQDWDTLVRLNFLTSPNSLVSGQDFFRLNTPTPQLARLQLVAGLNPIELGVYTNTNPWTVSLFNDRPSPQSLLVNDILFLPGDAAPTQASLLPLVTDITLSPAGLRQGKTQIITAQAAPGTTLSGSMLNHTLHFFPNKTSGYTALQGIPRMAAPGLTSFTITAATPDGRVFTLESYGLVESVDYGYDLPLEVDPAELDPAITEPEYALLMDIVDETPPDKLWVVKFASPSPTPDEITSTYGRVRSYNGSEYVYYHSGLDYRGFNETPVFAPAPGVVVFTGELDVRGNTTIISHGWGVYTGYWHQSRIDVKVGDTVQTGQTIGYCGDSGRATGPHLHFDLLVGGVEVDPEDWLYGTYAHVGN